MSSEDRYIPDPAATSDIHLPEDLMALGEDLAKNVHEVWAAGRIADGWTRHLKIFRCADVCTYQNY